MSEDTLYNVFHRTWWRHNPKWPEGLEPHPSRKTYLARKVNRQQALSLCDAWNARHKPENLSRKAEFESV